MGEVMSCALIRFSGDTKLGNPADMLKSRIVSQKDLGRLNEWASGNLWNSISKDVKFRIRKRKSHWNRQAGDQLAGEQLCWGGPGALCRQQAELAAAACPGSKEAGSITGCTGKIKASRLKEVIISLSSPLVRPHLEELIWGSTIQERHSKCEWESWSTSPSEKRLRELDLASLKKRWLWGAWEQLSDMYKEVIERMKPGLLQLYTMGRQALGVS